MPRPKTINLTQAEYRAEFNKANYERIEIVVPKGQKATVKAAAANAGESINQYTQGALLARMGLSEWPPLAEKQE